MSRTRTQFRCSSCSAIALRWAGRCASCSEWNCLVEEVLAPAGRSVPAGAALIRLDDVNPIAGQAVPLGVPELDRVLNGGLVPGSVTLLAGEPGIGKSTLLMQAASSVARCGGRALLVCAEESPSQVRRRADRLGAMAPEMWVIGDNSLGAILSAVSELSPTLVVVDSIQTISDPDSDGGAGSVTQVRHCAGELVRLAKTASVAVVLVGHVTKDGSIAGPRVLEHLVDTVLSFEGERHHALRLLRVVKHRFGPTDELGLFAMGEEGLEGVADASAMLLGDRRPGVAGSVVLPAMEGQRPLLVELQALVSPTNAVIERRSAQGVDSGRLALLIAVLERRAGISLRGNDVFASAVGGVKVAEPAADLAVALALVSARTGVALPPDVAVCGEVGLGGEVRQVAHISRRLSEAARLGFSRAVVPASAPDAPAGLSLIKVEDLSGAIDALDLDRPAASKPAPEASAWSN